jgi:hypothetical protein
MAATYIRAAANTARFLLLSLLPASLSPSRSATSFPPTLVRLFFGLHTIFHGWSEVIYLVCGRTCVDGASHLEAGVKKKKHSSLVYTSNLGRNTLLKFHGCTIQNAFSHNVISTPASDRAIYGAAKGGVRGG